MLYVALVIYFHEKKEETSNKQSCKYNNNKTAEICDIEVSLGLTKVIHLLIHV
jgi:hypothetical protein